MPEVTGQHRRSLLNGFLASTGSTHTSPALRMFLLCRVDVTGGAPSHWPGQSGHQVRLNLAVANDSIGAAQYYSICRLPRTAATASSTAVNCASILPGQPSRKFQRWPCRPVPGFRFNQTVPTGSCVALISMQGYEHSILGQNREPVVHPFGIRNVPPVRKEPCGVGERQPTLDLVDLGREGDSLQGACLDGC